ncbi:hypothetical protein NQO50_004406 [Vibrio vulnificus]|nr:hypothetical protein [Vibrio vulnificus]MCU8435048.1 hypothetical protein [Vibrio vulnificus]
MNKITQVLIAVLVFAACLLPISLYAYQFGFGLWDSHEDWGIMGSYFGGILAPIFTGISVIFLAFQIREQVKLNSQSLQERRATQLEGDIKYALPLLLTFLEDKKFISDLKSQLARYEGISDGDQLKAMTKDFSTTYIQPVQAWALLDGALRNLYRFDRTRYKAMTQYVIMHCVIERLAYLDRVCAALSGEKEAPALFLDKHNKAFKSDS